MSNYLFILAEKGASNLSEAFNLMKNVAETRSSVDSPEAFGQDLYVICAETAFQVIFSSWLPIIKDKNAIHVKVNRIVFEKSI